MVELSAALISSPFVYASLVGGYARMNRYSVCQAPWSQCRAAQKSYADLVRIEGGPGMATPAICGSRRMDAVLPDPAVFSGSTERRRTFPLSGLVSGGTGLSAILLHPELSTRDARKDRRSRSLLASLRRHARPPPQLRIALSPRSAPDQR